MKGLILILIILYLVSLIKLYIKLFYLLYSAGYFLQNQAVQCIRNGDRFWFEHAYPLEVFK